MRIAYGIHGFGRGHAMRALAVLPKLAQRHELLILAGGDAYRALQAEYEPVRIPTLKYYYNSRGTLSPIQTAKKSIPAIMSLKFGGPEVDYVGEILTDFKADIIISDSEAYTLWAGKHLKIPRISFDHFGLLVYCRLEMSLIDRISCRAQSAFYKWLYGEPDRVIVSGFFTGPARRPGVQVVGPVIREEVKAVKPTRGEHLLVYLSQGVHEFTPRLEQILESLDCPVIIYGTPRRGLQSNLQFKPLANLPFIEDLASCRAVFATTGNQLCGEIVHFGKPMLGVPMACLEQRLNARQIERLGLGRSTHLSRVNKDFIRDFLADEPKLTQNARRESQDGAREAYEAIEHFAAELVGDRGNPADVRTSQEGHTS